MAFTRAKPSGWSDGETLTAAHANALDIDHAKSIDGDTTGASGLVITSRSITRVVQCQPITVDAGGAKWMTNSGLIVTSTATAALLAIPVNVPDGATITSYEVFITGGTAHSALPGTMPYVQLKAYNPGYAVVQSPGAYDTSATKENYDAGHTVGESGLSMTINNETHRVWIYFSGESGANSQAGTSYYRARVTYTLARLDEGGA